MQSSLIGKIQKASMYAREPERVTLSTVCATFRGDHDSHEVAYEDGKWRCACRFFPSNGICTHVMAMQKMLGAMLPADARYWPTAEPVLAADGAGV